MHTSIENNISFLNIMNTNHDDNCLLYLKQNHKRGLVLCQHIQAGLKKNIYPVRIQKYCGWFFERCLQYQFHLEEEFIFPLLDKNNAVVKKALREHRKIKRLIFDTSQIYKSISLLEELLEAHTIYEERILFSAIQEYLTPEIQNKIIQQSNAFDMRIIEPYIDAFWMDA